jgi:hypothetical protein
MLVETMAAALFFAARTDDTRVGDAMVAETKVLLKRYLEPYTRRG